MTNGTRGAAQSLSCPSGELAVPQVRKLFTRHFSSSSLPLSFLVRHAVLLAALRSASTSRNSAAVRCGSTTFLPSVSLRRTTERRRNSGSSLSPSPVGKRFSPVKRLSLFGISLAVVAPAAADLASACDYARRECVPGLQSGVVDCIGVSLSRTCPGSNATRSE